MNKQEYILYLGAHKVKYRKNTIYISYLRCNYKKFVRNFAIFTLDAILVSCVVRLQGVYSTTSV